MKEWCTLATAYRSRLNAAAITDMGLNTAVFVKQIPFFIIVLDAFFLR